MVDAQVVLKDPLTFGAARVPSHFEHLNAEFSFDYVDLLDARFRDRLMGGDSRRAHSEIVERPDPGGDGWRFEGLNVETPESGFTLNGRVDRRVSPTELDLTVKARRFAFQEWAGVLSGLRNLAIQGPFTTRLKGPLRASRPTSR